MTELFKAFRDPETLQKIAAALGQYSGRPLAFMEVCGTHTMSVMRFGIKGVLPPSIRLVSGPGCPVCVTESSYIDMAVDLAERNDIIIATFGDLMRVPGSKGSLIDRKAAGADVRVVYSPLDSVKLAEAHPEKRVVFLSVGFETTTPVSALTVLKAQERGIRNLSLLVANKTMPNALEALAQDQTLQVDGFIFPGHVCSIIGTEFCEEFSKRYAIPGAVTGFEPADILMGIAALVAQIERGEAKTENLYTRVVHREGNRKALDTMYRVFEPCDAQWRGIGVIGDSGLRIRDAFSDFDAQRVFGIETPASHEPKGCLCGEILKGKKMPSDCPLFGTVCQPTAPVGACMVSSEGTCAAHYKYGDQRG